MSCRGYKRVFPVVEADLAWGLHVTAVGSKVIVPGAPYPDDEPGPTNWDWDHGRVLREFALVLVTQGRGEFQAKHAPLQDLAAGSAVLLFPGVWHRYRPSAATGWSEYWVTFDGQAPRSLVARGALNPKKHAVSPAAAAGCGLHELVVRAASLGNTPGSWEMRVAAAQVLQALATLAGTHERSDPTRSAAEEVVTRARQVLAARVTREVKMPSLARELGVGYSWFRQAFRSLVGMAPAQYHLDLRLRAAMDRLLQPDSTVKGVASILGFSSPYHFSRVFKEHMGLSPVEYRRTSLHRVRG